MPCPFSDRKSNVLRWGIYNISISVHFVHYYYTILSQRDTLLLLILPESHP